MTNFYFSTYSIQIQRKKKYEITGEGAERGFRAIPTYSWPIYVQIQAILDTLNSWIRRQKILLDAMHAFRFSIQQTIPWYRRHGVLWEKYFFGQHILIEEQ